MSVNRILMAAGMLLATLVLSVACGSDDSKPAAKATTPAAAASTSAPSSSASTPASGAANFTFVGFSDHVGPTNLAPTDVVASGGTIKGCNPPSLYAFVNFTGLTPPKQFVGNWTLNGAALSQQTLSETVALANTFWEVKNTPAALAAGSYTFQITVDGAVVTRGSFTLAC